MIKKLPALCYAILLIVLLPIMLPAQVVFSEDFDGVPGSTAGGPGTYSFPAGWFLRNVDNRPPAANVSYVNEAWERREDFSNNVGDSCAFSTSWYSLAGSAEDWMWTPAITLSALANSRLSWNALAYDAAYADGYEVRIMTVAPTGATGVMGNMLTNSTLLFSVTAENSTWTPRSVTLNSSYNGQTVYIGFRNNSNDKFLLAIDDVVVEGLGFVDASVSAANVNPYTKYSKSQIPVVDLGGTIRNAGGITLTNVNLVAAVFMAGNPVALQSTTGTAVASMISGATASFSCGTFTASAPGVYSVKYYPQITETEQNFANDTLVQTFEVTDSVMARDDNVIVGSLGIGAGNGGYLGQTFTITNSAELSSVYANYTRGYTGRKYAAVIWNTNASGVPTTILASTDTLLYTSNDAFSNNLRMFGGPLLLAPGNYVVTAVEFDSTLTLANANNVFTPGTVWVNWPTSPTGTWANVESFGPNFAKTFLLRLNLHIPGTLPVKLISFEGKNGINGNRLQWKVTEQTGIKEYVLECSSNGLTWSYMAGITANNAATFQYVYTDEKPVLGHNYYRLKIVEADGRFNYSKIIKISAAQYTLKLSPQPVHNTALLESSNINLLNSSAALISQSGVVVRRMRINVLPFQFDVSGLPAGVYLLKLQDNTVLRLIKQ